MKADQAIESEVARRRTVRMRAIVESCLEGRFTGSVEVQFRDGVPQKVAKATVYHLERDAGDLQQSG